MAEKLPSMTLWKTADPVAGTSAQLYVWNNETYADLEQSEPLGQRISAISPPEEGYQSYTAYKGNVGEPEWQCEAPRELYGSFSSLPWHCQRAAMERAGKETQYEHEKEENPKHAAHPPGARGPAPDGDHAWDAANPHRRGLNRLMILTLDSTKKRTNDDGHEPDDDETIRIEVRAPKLNHGKPVPLETGWTAPGESATLIDDGDQRRLAEEALNAVEEILWGDNPCADFFGGVGALAFHRLKKQILDAKVTSVASDDKTGIEMSETKNNRTRYYDSNGQMQNSRGVTTAFRVFGKLAIHNRGPFFNIQSTSRIGGYSAATIESRMAQILHELAHLIYRPYPGDELIPDDGGDASKSSGNTSTILDPGEGNGNCKAEIDAIAKRIREVS